MAAATLLVLIFLDPTRQVVIDALVRSPSGIRSAAGRPLAARQVSNNESIAQSTEQPPTPPAPVLEPILLTTISTTTLRVAPQILSLSMCRAAMALATRTRADSIRFHLTVP